jgi:hypothetical protein
VITEIDILDRDPAFQWIEKWLAQHTSRFARWSYKDCLCKSPPQQKVIGRLEVIPQRARRNRR